ncbi:AGAP013142-PA [Anopheles gambiae str. PEST]|uniref:AGAP013142-PA n=1 Tax=Anopheles gambiae TaxID=7165 RepID=F5HJ89_ANOGA|nr:AGAP013142-PA [Anopheles gambiae str. PEST]
MSEASWKTAEFFKDAIVRDLSLECTDSFTITSFEVGKANEKTTGYMSNIYRVLIELKFDKGTAKPTSLSYIVKEKTDTAFGSGLVELMSVFPKESEVYEKLLPAFERLVQHEKETVRFGPKVLKTTTNPDTVIVLEDLSRGLFRMREKSFNLPVTDVKRILEKLAKFHAASVLYVEKNGAFSNLFAEGVISERTIDALHHNESLYSAFVQSLRDRNMAAEYLQPLIKFDGQLLRECCKAQQVHHSELKVLNHGDLHIERVKGSLYLCICTPQLDFQTASYGSPVVDLLFLFATSATELMCDSLEELLQYYHEHLIKTLQHLQYCKSIPTYTELLDQMRRRSVLLLPPLSEAVAITMTGLTEPSDMEMITSEQPEGVALRKLVYNNPAYVALIDRLLPRLYELRLLK